MPVCLTCSECGLQPMSETGLKRCSCSRISANSSIMFQFSGPFRPLPAETTIFASGKKFSSLLRLKILIFWCSLFTSYSTLNISPSPSFSDISPIELGIIEIRLEL